VKTMSFKKILILLVVMILLPVFISSKSAFAEEPEIRVTIKGTISNIADVGQYILHQTHLHLYPCETTGRMNVQMNEKGSLEPVPGQEKPKFYLDGLNRLVPQSMLPIIGLPVFGNFNFFKARNLAPGNCYKICVMMLDNPYPGMVTLTDSNGNPFEFTIPEPENGENSEKIVIDLSEKELLIPKP